MFNTVHRKTFELPTESPIVRPDLSFSIKEIQQKFTMHQLVVENEKVQNNYLLSSDSDEFDSAPAEVPQNYDLVNAYADSNRLRAARLAMLDVVRNGKNPHKVAKEPISEPTADAPKTE